MIEDNRSIRNISAIVLTLALLQFILQVVLLARGTEFVVSLLTIDDTYYYLQSAWNFKHLGFVTFDGINPTNGVQLSWFWVLTILVSFLKTKNSFLFASLLVSFAINVWCYFPILKIGAALKRPLVTLLVAAFWSLEVFSGKYWFGMENSLHALVFWCVIWQAVEFMMRVRKRRRLNHARLVGLLVLNVWTRLDSAVFSLVIYAGCLLVLVWQSKNSRFYVKSQIKAVSISIFLASASMMAAPVVYHLMGGYFLPVSALVKTSGSPETASVLGKISQMFHLSFPSILPSPLRTSLFRGALCIMSLLMVWGVGKIRAYRFTEGIGALRKTLISVFIACVAYHFTILIFDISYYPYYQWYRSPLYIFWIITVAMGLDIFAAGVASILAKILSAAKKPAHAILARRLHAGAMIALLLVVFSHSGSSYYKRVNSWRRDDIRGVFYRASKWMSKNLPQDAICASWNAGVLGYFSAQQVINLDGLINSIEYYSRVLKGKVPLHEYLSACRVSYIIDYRPPPPSVEALVVHVFPSDMYANRAKVWKLK